MTIAVAATGCSMTGDNGLLTFNSLSPNHSTAKGLNELDKRFNVARLMESSGNGHQATTVYRKILETDNTYAAAHHRLAVIAAKNQQYDVAMQHFAAAESRLRNDADLYNDMGYVYLTLNDLARAEQNLRRAITINPQHEGARNNLGLVLGYQGKFNDSLREFQMATRNDGEAHANLAFVQSQTGALAEAEANCHRALEYSPNLRPAAEALMQIAGRNPVDPSQFLVKQQPTAVAHPETIAHPVNQVHQVHQVHPVQPATYAEPATGRAPVATPASGSGTAPVVAPKTNTPSHWQTISG